jgi:hypothetical protein
MPAAKFQDTSLPTSSAEVTQPVAGAIMHKEYVKTIGRMAYVWGWAMVNSFNRRAGITQAPAPGRLGGVVPVAPRGRLCMLNDYVLPKQSFVACPNQDVVYGVSGTVSGSMPSMMPVQTSSVKWANLMAQSRVSTCWSVLIGMARFQKV